MSVTMLHKSQHIKTYVSFIPFFIFWFLVTFGDEVTKTKFLRNVCLHFARQDGQDRKNGKKITQLK
jgi:hypothetical protein